MKRTGPHAEIEEDSMILHNLKRRSWHLILTSAVVIGLIQFCQPEQATAQVLNQRVSELLSRGCAGLSGESLGNGGTGLYGPQLTQFCVVTSGPGATSPTGGGAASVQGSAASILNRVLVQRFG